MSKYDKLSNAEKVDLFLKGEFTEEECSLFESELYANTELRSMAESSALMVQEMHSIGKAQDKEIVDTIKRQSGMSRIRTSGSLGGWKIVAVAACMVGLIWGGYRYYDYSYVTGLGKEYSSAFPFEEVVRGDSNLEVEEELSVLFDNITNNKDVKSTVSRLEVLWAEARRDTYNDYIEYESYIGWYLAMGYLLEYEKEDAVLLFESLLSENDSNKGINKMINNILTLL